MGEDHSTSQQAMDNNPCTSQQAISMDENHCNGIANGVSSDSSMEVSMDVSDDNNHGGGGKPDSTISTITAFEDSDEQASSEDSPPVSAHITTGYLRRVLTTGLNCANGGELSSQDVSAESMSDSSPAGTDPGVGGGNGVPCNYTNMNSSDSGISVLSTQSYHGNASPDQLRIPEEETLISVEISPRDDITVPHLGSDNTAMTGTSLGPRPGFDQTSRVPRPSENSCLKDLLQRKSDPEPPTNARFVQQTMQDLGISRNNPNFNNMADILGQFNASHGKVCGCDKYK